MSSNGKNLVLILGGVSYTETSTYTLNRIYERLAEGGHQDVEVVLVDPVEWKCGNKGGVTTHHLMTLAEYMREYPPEQLMHTYRKVAIVDDIKFKDYTLRAGHLQSAEHQRLVAIAEAHRDCISWWELYGAWYQLSGIRELNHVRVREGGTYIPLRIVNTAIAARFETLAEKGLIRCFRIGEAPAPENLLTVLFYD